MTAEKIIAKEYGVSRNFITPQRLEVGLLPNGAYELSTGMGFRDNRIWGVTVVWLRANGSTAGDSKRSGFFDSIRAARERIAALEEHGEGLEVEN